MKNVLDSILSILVAFVTTFITTLSAPSAEEVIALLKNANTELYKLKSSISNAIDEAAERFDSLIDELSLALEKKPQLEKRIKGCRACEALLEAELAKWDTKINARVKDNEELGIKDDNGILVLMEKRRPIKANLVKAKNNRLELEGDLNKINDLLSKYVRKAETKKVAIPAVKDLAPAKQKQAFTPCEYMLQLRTEDRMHKDSETNKLCAGFGEVAGVRYWLDRSLKECRDIRTSTNYNCVVLQVNERDAFVKKVTALNGKVIADASIATAEKKAANQ